MDKKINLIPEELTVPAKVIKLSNRINKISMISAFVLTIALVVGIVFFVYLDSSYKKIVDSNESLKSEITSLEKTEQQLVLTKDKINKIKNVRNSKTAMKTFAIFLEFKQFISNFPDLVLSEVEIDANKFSVSITSKEFSNVQDFLTQLVFSEDLKSVVLDSFGFSPRSGLSLNLTYEI